MSLRSRYNVLGGKLKIVAGFPEGEVAITNFSDVGEATTPINRNARMMYRAGNSKSE